MKLAVVTIAYPNAQVFFPDFFASLENQEDHDFSLWVGLDQVSPQIFQNLFRKKKIHFVPSKEGENPIALRNRTFAEAAANSYAMAFVDIDDVLLPSRIKEAKSYAERFDLTATAMNYINCDGKILPGIFNPSDGDPELILNNAFGFSNTTWRSDTMKSLLPAAENCVLMDWLLSSHASANGARIGYDLTPRMNYRQHDSNTAMVRAPFSKQQIVKATNLVLQHFSLLLDRLNAPQKQKFAAARDRILKFQQAIKREKILNKYVECINKLGSHNVWWSFVAHPELSEIWDER